MSAARRVVWSAIDAWYRLRFAIWAARLRASLRLRGGRLELDAPRGARLLGKPRIEFDRWGETGEARTVLRIGRDVTFAPGVVIALNSRGTNTLQLGDGVEIGDAVRLQVRNGAIRLGPNVRIRAFTVLKCEGEIAFAGESEVSYGAVIHAAERVEVGLGTGIAEHVSIVDSDHVVDGSDRHFYKAPIRLGAVVLEPNVFVAAGAVITRGTQVGRNSVVAAGAVLTGEREFPPSSLIAGAPARVVRELGERAQEERSSSER